MRDEGTFARGDLQGHRIHECSATHGESTNGQCDLLVIPTNYN